MLIHHFSNALGALLSGFINNLCCEQMRVANLDLSPAEVAFQRMSRLQRAAAARRASSRSLQSKTAIAEEDDRHHRSARSAQLAETPLRQSRSHSVRFSQQSNGHDALSLAVDRQPSSHSLESKLSAAVASSNGRASREHLRVSQRGLVLMPNGIKTVPAETHSFQPADLHGQDGPPEPAIELLAQADSHCDQAAVRIDGVRGAAVQSKERRHQLRVPTLATGAKVLATCCSIVS